MNRLVNFIAVLSLFLIVLVSSCTDPVILPSEKAYIGTENCKVCHDVIHENFMESGHPYKITKITNGQAPAIPFMPAPILPTGYTWNDISYTIGGFGWKLRFIDKNGYIITQIPGSQWNPTNNSQSVYNSSVPNGTEKYTCGYCHTTGWKSIADGGKPQDGLAGMDGEFFAGGVHCEACHGQGNVHAEAHKAEVSVPAGMDITTSRSNDLCAKCHYRRWNKGDLKQQTSGGWEMHRNQIEQLSASSHNSLTCVGCHDPHASTTKNSVAKGEGIKLDKTCVSCHKNTAKYSTTMHYDATCITCHMPRTVKNGISIHKFKGDAPNHNFKINTSETATYLTKDANDVLWANADKLGTTLDFVCYQCHKDDNGDGGTYSTKNRAQLTTKALTFHK